MVEKWRQILVLHELGFRVCEIAKILYDDYNVDPASACRRVNALIWKYKKRKVIISDLSGYNADEVIMSNIVFDDNYVYDKDDHAPVTDGTADIVERKRFMSNDERRRVEYEQFLYIIYTKFFSDVDDKAKTLWNSIKAVHNAVFNDFLKMRMKYMKYVRLAYAYLVMFFALKNFPQWRIRRDNLISYILDIVDEEKFREIIGKLMPLFSKFI